MKGVISGLPQAKINYTDVGFSAGVDKDTAKICFERVIRELAERARSVILIFTVLIFCRGKMLKWRFLMLENF